MTDRLKIWGAGPSARYDDLAARFRPLFEEIGREAVAREREHRLPLAEVKALKEAGFGALRLPGARGGAGASLPEFFALLLELSVADPNLTNAFRSHFGFVEDLVNSAATPWHEVWFGRIAAGQHIGSAMSEPGSPQLGRYDTRAERDGEGWVVNGRKFYTTGSLYADWINLGATDAEGQLRRLLVATDAEGMTILDDWDGFGQQLSASGTIVLENVRVAPAQLQPTSLRFSYSAAFFQLVHLATLAGIARAAADEVAALVAARKRVYGRGNAPLASADPQILEVVGRVRAAGAITLKAAEALERAHQGTLRGAGEDEARQLAREAEFEVNQSVVVVTDLVLSATTVLFDALGASAASRSLGLDRHWRNARTLSSHNPRVYHARIVGDWAVNARDPVPHGGVGVAPPG